MQTATHPKAGPVLAANALSAESINRTARRLGIALSRATGAAREGWVDRVLLAASHDEAGRIAKRDAAVVEANREAGR